jgi:hypothetical protein
MSRLALPFANESTASRFRLVTTSRKVFSSLSYLHALVGRLYQSIAAGMRLKSRYPLRAIKKDEPRVIIVQFFS